MKICLEKFQEIVYNYYDGWVMLERYKIQEKGIIESLSNFFPKDGWIEESQLLEKLYEIDNSDSINDHANTLLHILHHQEKYSTEYA